MWRHKVDHEQVKSWILDPEASDTETSRLAAAHLAECGQCRAFSERWAAARQALEAGPMVGPEPGFRDRWLERLVVARRLRHRRQTALALALTALGAISTFSAMVWWVLDAPAKALGTILSHLAVLDIQLRFILDSIRIVTYMLPPLANLGIIWAGVALALGLITLYTGFSALWTASFFRTVLQTRTKEN